MKTIYVVESASGEYEDYRTWVEKAFNDLEAAQQYAKHLDELRLVRPQFITDEFIAAYEECYDNLPDWEDGPLYKNGPKKYVAWVDQKNIEDRQRIIDAMYKKGFMVTEQMLQTYNDWEDSQYEHWHPCHVQEIELV